MDRREYGKGGQWEVNRKCLQEKDAKGRIEKKERKIYWRQSRGEDLKIGHQDG
jgi:hypothetical protein